MGFDASALKNLKASAPRPRYAGHFEAFYGGVIARQAMSWISPYFALVLLALISAPEILAADYENGLAPPGAPPSAFPTPSRPVAGIVTDIWRDEESRDRASEAENVMNLLGVNSGFAVADIGAGSDYYTVRLARRVGTSGHGFAQDIVSDYLPRLSRRGPSQGVRGPMTNSH